jgi:hypothetical protein
VAGRLIDQLKIRVLRYDGIPLPNVVVEGHAYSVVVEAEVDREKIIDQLKAEMGSNPFVLDEKYAHTSWGADGSILEIILGVSGGLPGAIYVAEKILSATRHKDVGDPVYDMDSSTHLARSVVAEARQVKESEVDVAKGTETTDGFEFEVLVEGDTYRVQVERSGVTHFEKARDRRLFGKLRRRRQGLANG